MSKKSKGKGKDYNNFDEEFNKTLSATFNNNNKKDKNNQLMKSDIKKSINNNIKNKKRKVSIFPNKSNKVKRVRAKSEEKKSNKLESESEADENEKDIEYTKFNFDTRKTTKCMDKSDEFVSFSDLIKLKDNYFEKQIKSLIKNSEKIHTYEVLDLKNENLKNIQSEFDTLMDPKKSFEENKERLKLGAYKYISNFKKIFLSKYEFSFDNSKIKKLDIFVDNPSDNNINYFSKNNQIFSAYRKKNIKYMTFNIEEDIEKPIEEIKIDNDNDIYGSISKINQRWLNKIKFTKKMNKPNIDNNKVNYNFKNSLEIPLIEQVFQEFVKQKIKSYEIDIDKIKRPNTIFNNIQFVTEINFSFKEDNNKIGKMNLDKNIFIKDSIKEINAIYNRKYLFNMDTKSEILVNSNKNIFLLDDLNIINNYEKCKKWKNERISKKNKYICSGNASLALMKNALSNKKYDNPDTNILHNLSIQLNELSYKTSNDNLNLDLAKYKSVNNNYSKCAKKLKDEIDLSLSNKISFNSKLGFNKFKSENLDIKKKLSSVNSQKNENKEKNKEYKYMIKRITKTEDEINKKNRKIYASKIKQKQDSEFEQEIKKENKFKIIFPIVLFLVPIIYSFFNRYWNE